MTSPPPVITLSQLLDTLDLEQVNAEFFVGNQIDEIGHHISGGHIAAQALVGSVLLEGIASFSRSVESAVYQQLPPDLPDPEAVPTFAEQHSDYAEERSGWWVREQPIDWRYVDPSARLASDLAESPASIRMWWRPNGIAPADPVVAGCLTAFVAGRTLLESAMIARGTTPLGPGFSALMDLAVWFHHPPDLSDWLLYELHSPSGIGGRGLAQGTMFNRTGELVRTMTLECYFAGRSSG